MPRKHPYYIQMRITENQAEILLDLLEDELENDDLPDLEGKALAAVKKSVKHGLRRLDHRLDNLEKPR